MGTIVVAVDEARFGCGVEFLLQCVGGEMSQKIGNRGRWNEGGSTLEITIFKGFSDLRCTHHLAIFLHSFNFAHFWQHFAHQFIVVTRECIVWLTADEANRGTECGRKVSFENVEVEQHLRVGGIVEAFQEVSRERSGGNRVVAAFAKGDRSPTPALHRKGGGFRFYQFDSGLNHRFPLDVREQRLVFLHGNHEKLVNLPCGFFYQIKMAACEGVGIHHDDAGGVGVRRYGGTRNCIGNTLQIAFVSLYSLPVFHQNGERSLSHEAESETLKNLAVLRLRKHFHRLVSALRCFANQVRNQSVADVLVAQLLAHGNTLDDIALQAASGQNFIAVGTGDDGIVVHLVQPELVGFEELFYPAPPKRHGERNGLNLIVHHRHQRFRQFGLAVVLANACGCAYNSGLRARRAGNGAARRRWHCAKRARPWSR